MGWDGWDGSFTNFNVRPETMPLYSRDVPPPLSEGHPVMPKADFLSSFIGQFGRESEVQAEQSAPGVLNKVFNGDPSDPSRTLGETLKGLLESNSVPIPLMESNSVQSLQV